MQIRQAHAGDLDALVGLESHFPTDRLSRASFRRLLRRGRAQIWVCEHDGAVVGNTVVLYRRGMDAARCYSLVVHPDHRRRGIARALLQRAEAAAVTRGCRAMRLEVRPDNRAALGFYRENGYEVTEKIAGFYEDGTDAFKLRKQLAPVTAKAGARSRRPRMRARAARASGATSATPAAAPGSARKSAAA
jgi:ribosomal-protein-alanine N-acetyltransferase